MRLFSRNIIIAILIFFLLAGAYSFLSDRFKKVNEISLSDLVEKINKSEVAKIIIQGDTLAVTFKDGQSALAKKEPEAAARKRKQHPASERASRPAILKKRKKNKLLYGL